MVVAPDLRALGLSSKPDGGYDKENQAADLWGVLDTLGMRTAELVTHDIGIMVGFAVAATHPERVSRWVMKAREADRTRELAEQGHVVRLWMLPPTPCSWRALGLWRATDGELQAMLKSLPMDKWMTTGTTPLTEHPNDPAKPEM